METCAPQTLDCRLVHSSCPPDNHYHASGVSDSSDATSRYRYCGHCLIWLKHISSSTCLLSGLLREKTDYEEQQYSVWSANDHCLVNSDELAAVSGRSVRDHCFHRITRVVVHCRSHRATQPLLTDGHQLVCPYFLADMPHLGSSSRASSLSCPTVQHAEYV